MPDPRTPQREERAAERIDERVQELIAQAPRLDEKTLNELRPLLRAENSRTDRGKGAAKKDGTAAGAVMTSADRWGPGRPTSPPKTQSVAVTPPRPRRRRA